MGHRRKGVAGERGKDRLPGTPPRDAQERPGTGALCAEAQADGVPCFELGRDCAVCEHARGAGTDPA